MKRESLLNLKTCREIVTGMDIARGKKQAPTMFQRMRRIVARGTGEFTPHPNEATLAVELDKERSRFSRRFQKVERAAAKILGFRQKLANTHEKNRRIMDLRLELQRQYWKDTRPAGLQAPHWAGATIEAEGRKIKVRRLRYGGRS
jgi:AraC-like DNA-binding protein